MYLTFYDQIAVPNNIRNIRKKTKFKESYQTDNKWASKRRVMKQ